MKRAQRVSRICDGTGTNAGVRERGFTLLEVLIVSAIAITVALAGLSLTQASRPFSARSAAIQFDAAVAYARAVAASGANGSTIVFLAGTNAPGFVASIYAGRPSQPGALVRAPSANFTGTATLDEISLGSPPFSVFFDGAGRASAVSGDAVSSPDLAADPGCPAGGSLSFDLRDARSRTTRSLPCAKPLAGAAGAPSPEAN